MNANLAPTRQARGASEDIDENSSSAMNRQEAENLKKTMIRLTEIAEKDRSERAAAGLSSSSGMMRITSVAQFKS